MAVRQIEIEVMKMKNKGFTLIESIVAMAISAMVFTALAFAISTISHYYIASNNIKDASDDQYEEVLNATTSSESAKYTLSMNVSGDSEDSSTSTAGDNSTTNTADTSDTAGTDDTADQLPKASINNISVTKNKTTKTADGNSISYFYLTSASISSRKRITIYYTVYDRLQFKDASSDKGPWSSSDTYEKGDFVTYEKRKYLLVEDSQNGAPGTEDSGWQLLADYKPSGSLFSTYLDGDLFLKTVDGQTNLYVYLNGNDCKIGTYNATTHEVTDIDETYSQYITLWKTTNMYLLDNWKEQPGSL
jgi:prepilin-type N-terminal cleavage/methylation domain-containing protein